jgi:hypothetical protein
MLKTTTLQLSALALAAVFSGSAIPATAEEETSAAAVLDHHVQAFAAGDVDAMLADYTEDSVFITPQDIFEGAGRDSPTV